MISYDIVRTIRQRLTFYDWLLKNGISESKAIEFANLYCFGGIVDNLQDKLYIQNLIDSYDDYIKGGKNG